MADLLDPLPGLSLLCQRPAVQDRTDCLPEWKSLLHGEGESSFRTLLSRLPLQTILMELGSSAQGITHAKGVRTLLRQDRRLVVLHQPLVRMTKPRQCPGG